MHPLVGRRGVAVARLRVRDARRDPLAAQLRVARVLAGADVTPSLPAAAILLVRSLADPLPRALAASGHAVRPSSDWERALERSLEGLAREAARPGDGPVPAGARAVLFADSSELLAFLGLDLADRAVPLRWWWAPVVRRAAPPHEAVAEAWSEAAEAVPAALDRLTRRRAAGRVVRALGPDASARVAAAVARRYALFAVEDAVSISPRRARPEAERVTSAARDSRRRSRARDPLPRPPWSAVAPEAVDPALAPAERRLLALGLVLRRDPVLARSRRFAAWLAHTAGPFPPRGAQPRLIASDRTSRLRRHAAVETDRAGLTPGAAAAVQDENGVSAGGDGANGGVPVPRAVGSAEVVAGSARAGAEPAASEPAEHGPEGAFVDTALGGVFFLANVALALGFYGDFTSPRRTGLRLDFWRFLGLLAERLLAPRPLRRDPLWAALAELAGPDASFRPRPLPRRLVDGLATRDRGILRRVSGETDLDRWIAQVAVVVRARLRAAGVDPSTLLRRRARVHVSETRVDVMFSLGDHPLEIRLAGLDRDPGWVPAAGRTIAFQFG